MNATKIQNFLKFRGDCPYFGKLTRAKLSKVCGPLYRSKSEDWERPLEFQYLEIGTINNSVICDTLWRLMSYNPARWGNDNPFKFGLDVFCNKPGNKTGVMESVHKYLSKFLYHNNYSPDVATDGYYQIQIGLKKNYKDRSTYDLLKFLLLAAQEIADKNESDFMDENKRDVIVAQLAKIHPVQFGIKTEPKNHYCNLKICPKYLRLREEIKLAKECLETSNPDIAEYRQDHIYWTAQCSDLKKQLADLTKIRIPFRTR